MVSFISIQNCTTKAIIRVAKIVETKKRVPKSFRQKCSEYFTWSKDLNFSFVNKRVVLVPIVFLFLYYLLQLAYQLDF